MRWLSPRLACSPVAPAAAAAAAAAANDDDDDKRAGQLLPGLPRLSRAMRLKCLMDVVVTSQRENPHLALAQRERDAAFLAPTPPKLAAAKRQ